MFRVQPVQLLSRLNRLDGRTSCPPDRGMQRAVPQLDDKNHFFFVKFKDMLLICFCRQIPQMYSVQKRPLNDL